MVPALPYNALIVVDGSQGDFVVTDAVNMQPGQTLVGGGSTLLVTSPTCNIQADLVLPGTPGTIVRNDLLGNVVNMQQDGTIQNIGVVGGLFGVEASGAPRFMILDSRFQTFNGVTGLSAAIVVFENSEQGVIMNNSFLFEHDPAFVHFGIISLSDQITIMDNVLVSPNVAPGSIAMFLDGSNNQFLRNRWDLTGETGVFYSAIDSLFEGNIITGAAGDGAIRIGGASGNRFANNLFETNSTATVHTVYFRGGNDNNIFENNRVNTFATATGVTVDSSANTTVRNNTIRTFGDGTALFGPAGIFCDSGSPGTLIENNDIETVGEFGHGMRIRQCSDSIFRNNDIRVSGLTSDGFSIENLTSNLLFENNDVNVSGISSRGVAISGGSNVDLTFTQNDFVVSLGNGGDISGPLRVTFDDNFFRADSGDGLNVISTTDIQVSNNRFSAIGGEVIDITGSAIVDPASSGNTWDGTGGGSLCTAGGGNTGSISFTSPVGTCP